MATRSESIEGYLFKLGGKGKKWKKRYVVLYGDKIDYFKKKGASKVHGSIQLSEAKGVREMSQCTCKWPPSTTEQYAFGVATKSRTYYFHSTPEEGNVSGWKSKVQTMVQVHGSPDTNWKEDHEGNPEGNKSFIARKLASAGSVVAKEAIKHAPVDDKVKKGVGAGADAVKDQAEADPNAGMGERLALGVKGTANVVGATGVGGETGKIVTGVVAAGADMAKDQAAADPDASIEERLALGVKGTANMVGATGVGGEAGKIATGVIRDGAKETAKALKENRKDNDS